MQVGTQSVPCLIDTGCELSLVPLKLVSGSTLEPTSQKVYAANESEISILGKTRLHFKLHAQVPTYADVLVTEDIEEPMLGIDWLTKHCSRWDFLTGMLYINGVPLKLVARECRNLCRRVYAVQEITLPARHQGNVAARSTSVNLHDTNMNWALESHRLQPGLMVARSLLPGRHHDLVIRLLNTTDKPQVVGAGTCLGVLQPVQVCGETTAISGSHVDGVATVDRRASFVSNTAGAETCQFCDESDMLSTDRVRVQSGQACSTRKELVNDPFVQMFEGLSAELTDGQRQTVVNLLQEFEDVFSKDDYDLGQTDLVEHRIDTGGHRPFRQTLRRHPVAQLPVIDEHVEQMLQQGIVEPCASPWSSNVVLVRRKDGKYRFCVDYRQLNSITYQDVYPLPRIENCLDALDGASWFSTLDLRSGYWQVRQDPRDADKTAFITRRGCFLFKTMSFGLTNAPSVFQRLMDLVLSGLAWEICLVYLDDVIIFSTDFDEHIRRLKLVLDRLRNANLKLKPSKCSFLQRQVKFLGHVVSGRGVQTDPEKVAAVRDWPIPRNVTDVRMYIGFCSYYRKFICRFADIAAPLYNLMRKQVRFEWSAECQVAFDRLKEALVSSPVLAQPRHDGQFILDTDASMVGIGAVLSQMQDGQERVVAYSSRRLSDAERRYSVTRLELLAVVYGLRQYRQYLLGRHFLIRTDHAALQWLQRVPEPIGQQARWLDLLGEYDFVIRHRNGTKHGNADALSRLPELKVAANPTACQGSEVQEGKHNSTSSIGACAVRPAGTVNPSIDNSWTPESIGAAQAVDPAFGVLYRLRLDHEDRPPFDSVQTADPEAKAYWSQWNQLTFDNAVLYRQFINPDGTVKHLQLIPPRVMRSDLIRLSHTGMTGGHLGFKKTYDQVSRRAYWCGIRSDVLRYCRSCPECSQYRRGAPQRNGLLHPMVMGAPNERFAIDLTGPHPRSRRGKTYILTVIDCYTKFAEAIAIPNKEATTVAQALVEQVLCRYGLPLQLLSDQGKEFENNILHEVCRLLGVDKVRSTAYKPSTNGCVERLHSTMNSMIGRVVDDNQRNWDEVLPYVMAAYRSSVHESTGYTPNFLTFGREVRAPIDVVLGRPNPDQSASVDDYANEIVERLTNAYQLVREHLGVAAERTKKYYDLRARPVTFQPGDQVWVYHPRRRVGRSPKWSRWFSGPFVVEHAFNDVLYRVRRNQRSKAVLVHVDKMKRYLDVETAANGNSMGDEAVTAQPAEDLSVFEQRPRREIRLPVRYRT